MRTEEANCLKDKMDSVSLYSSKTNLVESIVPTNTNKFKGNDKENKKPSYPKRQNKLTNKIQKPKRLCYVCGKYGHKAYECPFCKGQSQPNRKPVAQVNLVEDTEVICAVVEEANLVANSAEWIHNTGASRYFYANKELMQDFEDVADLD